MVEDFRKIIRNYQKAFHSLQFILIKRLAVSKINKVTNMKTIPKHKCSNLSEVFRKQ